MIEPKVGQIWADNDWRCQGRKIRIDRIEGEFAYCTVVADATEYPPERPRVGTTTRIRLRRLRPTSTGYRLEEQP